MGRGGRAPVPESLLRAGEILARARLAPNEAPQPGRIARAIRAELWYGSLDGARVQAHLGATTLLTAERPWRAPALLYLGLGREHAAAVCMESAPAIIAGCATDLAAIRHLLCRSSIEGITRLLELVDVLGPILWLSPTRALGELAAAAVALTVTAESTAKDSHDALAAAGAREADRRLRGWPRIEVDRDAAAALVHSYMWSAGIPREWDEQPRMELVMVHDANPSTIPWPTQPPALVGQRWSSP